MFPLQGMCFNSVVFLMLEVRFLCLSIVSILKEFPSDITQLTPSFIVLWTCHREEINVPASVSLLLCTRLLSIFDILILLHFRMFLFAINGLVIYSQVRRQKVISVSINIFWVCLFASYTYVKCGIYQKYTNETRFQCKFKIWFVQKPYVIKEN